MTANELMATLASKFDSATSGLRVAFEGLNERERRLAIGLAVVLGSIIILLPVYLMTTAISDIDSENQQISTLLREMSKAEGKLAEREAQRAAAIRRYANPAPPLGSFVEAQASEQQLSLREVTDQPEKIVDGFKRQHVRATMPKVGLRPAILMFASIKNSQLPVAIEKIQIENFRSGDTYNVQLGLISYEKTKGKKDEDEEKNR